MHKHDRLTAVNGNYWTDLRLKIKESFEDSDVNSQFITDK